MCDHSKPIVDDGQGNRNNLLVVKSETPVPKAEPAKTATKADQSLPAPPATVKAPEAAPLLKHEAIENHLGECILKVLALEICSQFFRIQQSWKETYSIIEL